MERKGVRVTVKGFCSEILDALVGRLSISSVNVHLHGFAEVEMLLFFEEDWRCLFAI